MQEFKGSPAPWRLGLYGQVKDAEHNIVADVYNTGHAYGRANANLIAAAPALLEALIVALPMVEAFDFSNGNVYNGLDEGQVISDQIIEQMRAAIAATLGQHGDTP